MSPTQAATAAGKCTTTLCHQIGVQLNTHNGWGGLEGLGLFAVFLILVFLVFVGIPAMAVTALRRRREELRGLPRRQHAGQR